MKHRLQIVYRAPRVAGARCALCGDSGHLWAIDRRTFADYSFRCSCVAGDTLPAWMTTWSQVDLARFRSLSPKETPAVVAAAMRAGTDAVTPPAPLARAAGAAEPARHWTERD